MPPSRRSFKKAVIVCQQCKLQVNEEEEASIQCDKCSKTFHALCTKLDKRQYDKLMDDENEEYVCHICDNKSGDDVKSELNAIREHLNKQSKQLDTMQESMTFMARQFDEIIKGVAENKKKVEAVQKENKMLKSEINELKDTVRFLNNNRVRNDCLISGVEVESNENAMESLIKVMKAVDITLDPNEVDDVYFIGKNKEAKRKTIVAKFNTKATKQKVISAKLKLNGNEATKSIFVNDFLGKETLQLLNYAKTLKSVGYRRVYANGGKVYVKMTELSKPKLVKNEDQVDSLLLEATRTTSRRSQCNRKVIEPKSDDENADDDDYMSP